MAQGGLTERGHVLVTGGAGYIGAHTVLALLDSGYHVTVLDDLSTGIRAAVPSSARFHQGDVGDAALLSGLFGGERFDAIVHFAGSLIVSESVRDPLAYYGNNSCKTRILLAEALKAGIDKLVFSSSAAVYGTPESVPIPETAPTVPINPYGASKLMIEWMLRDARTAHGLRYAALRYFNVAGADPQMRAGQSNDYGTHLVKVTAEHLAGTRPMLEIFGTDYDTPDGTCVRDYIHVSDLADLHVMALHRLMDGGDSLAINCGYGHGFSVREVLDVAARVGKRPLDVREAPRRPGDPAELVADTRRLHDSFDWTPRFDDLETIVRHALEWEWKLAELRKSG